MRLPILTLATLILLAGCAKELGKCEHDTVFVTVALTNSVKAADHLEIDVSIDGGTPVHTSLPHTAGVLEGGVRVEFPNGYPKGHSFTITIQATLNGQTIGVGTATLQLAGGCSSTKLDVLGPDDDLASPDLHSSPPGDLPPGSDLTSVNADLTDVPPPDLFGADFSGLDLTVVDDLSPPADLVPPPGSDLTCVPSAEDCFNNADDDCDGLVDCADPDCSGGGSPIAECVFKPGTATPGTKLSNDVSCPGSYPTKTPIGSSFQAATCSQGSCGATGTPNDWCETWLLTYSASDTTCSCSDGLCTQQTLRSDEGCRSITPVPSTANFKRTLKWTGDPSNCSVGGAPAFAPAKFGATDTFCTRSSVGGGCTTGKICVPKAANHCALLPGSQVPCPTNYVKSATPVFLGINNGTYACACTPFITGAGSCSGEGNFYSSGICSDTLAILGPACGSSSAAIAAMAFYQVPAPVSRGTCGAFAGETGTTPAPTGEQTVCCLP